MELYSVAKYRIESAHVLPNDHELYYLKSGFLLAGSVCTGLDGESHPSLFDFAQQIPLKKRTDLTVSNRRCKFDERSLARLLL